MPGVDVYYQHGSMEKPVADAIMEAVCAFGFSRFNDPGETLSFGDFSFKFHEPHRFDNLTDEIIVRVSVRSLRDSHGLGTDAHSIAQLIAENIGHLVFGTVGVELRHDGRIGWATSELFGPRPVIAATASASGCTSRHLD